MMISLFLLSGCGMTAETEENVPVSESAISELDMDDLLLFEITEWDFKDVRESIYADGVRLPLPCDMTEIPDGFCVNGETLYHGNEAIGTAMLSDNKIITYIFLHDDVINHNITVGKINPDDSIEKIISEYGESNDSWSINNNISSMLIYRFRDGSLAFSYFDGSESYDSVAISYLPQE